MPYYFDMAQGVALRLKQQKEKNIMATPAVIRIEGFDAASIYKHHDGYPDDMLPWLEEFNKDFNANRGNDVQYKFAQLLRSSERDAGRYGLCQDKHLGWGVISGLGMGVYTYTLKLDGTVTYFKGNENE